MKKYREIMCLLHDNNTKYVEMTEYNEIMEDLFEKLEMAHKDMYCDVMYKLEKIAYKIDKDEARRIVMNMKPFGEKWSYEKIKDYVNTKGIMDNCVEYYLVMNMVYNDYYNVAINFGHETDVEFYYELANAFINDEDGKKFKVEKYFID